MRVENISKSIHRKQILTNINFSIEPGKITGLIGRNGAGKTTLLRLMVGIINPTSGEVKVNGQSIYTHPKRKQDIVFVPDSPEALKTYSIKEIERLYAEIYPEFDKELFYQLIERFHLPKQGKIGSYSKGMKALFALILAFSTKAQYILLDEPTDGLDVIVKKQILQFIVEAVADYQVSVVISSHRLDELEYLADSIIMLKDGEITKTYELETIKEAYKKIQVVFPEGLPDEMQEIGILIQKTGKVFIFIIDGELEEKMKRIEAVAPLYYEELSMTLEDLFIAKLGGEGVVS